MRFSHLRVMFAGAAVLTLAFMCAGVCQGEAYFTGDPMNNFADAINNPADKFTWDGTSLTWRFAPDFLAAFPNPRIHDQIRATFRQWDNAFGTPTGASFSYGRANGYQNFGDIRSIALHEVGHVLGLHHPDQGDDVNRNYRPTGPGSSLVAVAAHGGEVMRSWINPGDYNRVLSNDELTAFARAYGRDLNFVERPSSDMSAQIVIGTQMAGPSNWASGGASGVYRTGSVTGGVRSTSGFVNFNVNSSVPIGLKTKGVNWDFHNASGASVAAFEIRTRGTDLLNPIFHYDNNGPRRFQTFHSMPMGSTFREDVTHRWSNPLGGPIPASEVLHVGLELDVWDWSVVTAQTVSPGGVRTSAPVLTFHDWTNTIVEGTPAGLLVETEDGHGEDHGELHDFHDLTNRAGKTRILARGIRLVAPEDTRIVLSDFAVAPVSDLDLGLNGLNRSVLESLGRRQRLQFFDLNELSIPAGGDFVLVLEGGINSLPPDLIQKKNFRILDRPDLASNDLFLYALAKNDAGAVGSFGLISPKVESAKTYRLPGDANLDGKVNLADFNVLKRNFGMGELWAHGNFDGDLDVDLEDFNILKKNFGAALTVPEPSGMALALFGAVAIFATAGGIRRPRH